MTPSLRKLFKGKTCIVCGKVPIEICHIKTKKTGGDDEEWNLYPGCFQCHQLIQHRIGIVSFFLKFPQVRSYFEAKGWRLEEVVGKMKLTHPNLEAA